MRTKQNALVLSIILIVIMGLVVTMLFRYHSQLKKDLAASTSKTMLEVIDQQTFNFTSEIEADYTSIIVIAEGITTVFDIWNEDLLEIEVLQNAEKLSHLLNRFIKNSKFEYLTIVDLNGDAVLNTGKRIDLSESKNFKSAIAGATSIGEAMKSPIRDDTIIPLSTPLYHDGKIVGAIIGTYNSTRLSTLLLPSFDNNGYSFVTDANGDMIAGTRSKYTVTDGNNLFESWEDAVFSDLDDLETIKSNVKEQKPGSAYYMLGTEKRFMHYKYLGINDWYIFTIVPENVISEDAFRITKQATVLIVTVVLLFGFMIGFILVQKLNSDRIFAAYMDKLEKMAFSDELTGIPNMAKFKIDCKKLLNENNEKKHILVKIDMVKFKLINEMYDFDMGDKVINAVAQSLREIAESAGCLYARINADEFIMMGEYELVDLQRESDRFEALIKANTSEMLGNYRLEFKYGIYMVEPGDADINSMLEKVNFTHRIAKATINTPVSVYNEHLHSRLVEEKEIENNMENALFNEEFRVFLQPKYRLSDEQIDGAEALVRWHDKNVDVVYPGKFIPLFEQNGFIVQLDMYMFERVCGILRNWIDNKITPVDISVNFSRHHLNNPHFVDDLCSIADKYGVPHKYLEIELTESTMFGNEELILKVLDQLHAKGFTLSMDDFGTGYSSLGLLKNLPIDVIKIDRAFFIATHDMSRSGVVISNVMKMAHELGIKTVAEGVETKETIDFLWSLGCDVVQGYYYSKPLPIDELTQKLMAR